MKPTDSILLAMALTAALSWIMTTPVWPIMLAVAAPVFLALAVYGWGLLLRDAGESVHRRMHQADKAGRVTDSSRIENDG